MKLGFTVAEERFRSEAAAWLNRYAKYWQGQFETLAQHLIRIEREKS